MARQNRGMTKVNFKLLEGPFAFVSPSELLTHTEGVEEKEALVS